MGEARRLAALGQPLVAEPAIEQRAEPLTPAHGVDDPGSQLKRRPVADVPPVAAGELRNPLALLVLVETDDPAFHPARVRRRGRGPRRAQASSIEPVETREATCSCGQLRVTVEGDPFRISICHCVACQRRTGSAFGFQARWPEERVAISGRSSEYTRSSDFGEGRTFHFCPDCGATVFWRTEAAPGVAVAVGAFADPSFPPPRVSVWESRRHAWVSVPEAIEHEED